MTKVIGELFPWPLHEFINALPAAEGFVPKADKKETERVLRNWHKNNVVDVNSIVGTAEEPWGGCRFIRWTLQAPAEQNYHEWLAQLRMTSRFHPDPENAYKIAKTFSEKDPRFNESEFSVKFNEALLNMFPPTCGDIEKVWRFAGNAQNACKTCPHRKYNFPLSIKRYPNKDNGFRDVRMAKTLSGKPTKVAGKVDNLSLTRYLRDKHKVFAERDECLYRWDKYRKYYKPLDDNQLISDYSALVSPQLRPTELRGFKEFLKNHFIVDREAPEDRTKNKYLFFVRSS